MDTYVATIPRMGTLYGDVLGDKRTIVIRILRDTPQSDESSQQLLEVLDALYDRHADLDFYTWCTWEGVWIKITITFDELICSPEGFLWSQLNLIRRRWAFSFVVAKLRFYLEHIGNYDANEIDIEVVQFEERYRQVCEKYHWVTLTLLGIESNALQLDLRFYSYSSRGVEHPTYRDHEFLSLYRVPLRVATPTDY
jgi:hypothetical protein